MQKEKTLKIAYNKWRTKEWSLAVPEDLIVKEFNMEVPKNISKNDLKSIIQFLIEEK